jgi:hypothetical protein
MHVSLALKIKMMGDVEAYLRNLNEDRSSRWGIAARMFANAMREPVHLKAARMSFQTALMLDGLLVRINRRPRERNTPPIRRDISYSASVQS